MDKELILAIILLGLFIVCWLLYISAKIAILFAASITLLHPAISILIFIIFPPAFLFFLYGCVLMGSNFGKKELEKMEYEKVKNTKL